MRESLKRMVTAVGQRTIIDAGVTTEIAEIDMTLRREHQTRKTTKRKQKGKVAEKALEVALNHPSHSTKYATNGETEANAPMETNAVLSIQTKMARIRGK